MNAGDVLDLLLRATGRVREAVGGCPPALRGEAVGMGADGQPTTRVDRLAEEALIAVLEKAGFPVTLISEEAGELSLAQGPDPVEILADPVDSTVNAILGLPYYASALTAVHGGRPVAAAVRNLATGEAYGAAAGAGAWLDGRPLAVSDIALRRSVVSFGPIAEPFALRVLSEVERRAAGVRLFACPSLSLVDVASGRFGAFLGLGEAGKVHRLFDVMASAFIVEAAGGRVTTSRGEPLPTDIRDLRGAVTVVAAAPQLQETLLELLDALRGVI